MSKECGVCHRVDLTVRSYAPDLEICSECGDRLFSTAQETVETADWLALGVLVFCGVLVFLLVGV